MTAHLTRILTTTAAICMLAFASVGHARAIDESPSAGAMAVDAVFARPILLATTVVGTALYVVSLPFSLLGGNAEEAGQALVVGPAKATFVRCLGCERSGRKDEVVAQTDT
ncbi:hypothetical protein [Marinobacter sp. X15-166B]|uniref:hypothetical protein n=1 Tax=Marinobacter sp. X15-166B TaxID=1897620 RepID=UPI00085C329B|nr:hypothetical protein [Marinobacter sp. X15-166B]OEY65843.1 hypothetical protein BG841_04835 [Marinobacter sp. X15-166B]